MAANLRAESAAPTPELGSARGAVNSSPSLVAVASNPSRDNSVPARAINVSADAGVVKDTISDKSSSETVTDVN